jgi:beta-glucosidase
MVAIYVFLVVVLVVLLVILVFPRFQKANSRRLTKVALDSLGVEAPILTREGHTFRDLNKNGKLDVYEDTRRPIEERVEDLLSQMTLEEKAGLMFHTMIGMNNDGTLVEDKSMFNPVQTSDMVIRRRMNHFNILQGSTPRHMAEWHNRIQQLAERTRLGIPITISSDPRHAFSNNPLANLLSSGFSQWCEPIGLAATRDPDLVRMFGDIARQEYVAVGIRVALHPMADLATEPRWARINGTFGEDADLSVEMTTAYIQGFQGESLGPGSVACMTKHFPGGGAQKDGEDPHFSYGKEQIYPGKNWDYHLRPFEAALKAGTAQIMPYYGMPVGTPFEQVGFGFNRDVITGLLRQKYGFDGIVCTDWMLLTPMKLFGLFTVMEAKSWGVEHLTIDQKMKKALDAGVDQFGGEACPEVVVRLVAGGQVSEERINQSVRRLLREKFRLGLFDHPYVDVDVAGKIVGNPEFCRVGELAQRKSIVLLKNAVLGANKALPLRGKPKIFIENFNPEVAGRYGQVVQNIEEADVAILRINTPFRPRKGFLERFFHAGDLDFLSQEKARLLKIIERLPTVVDIFLDRPAVIPEITGKCAGLLADFGASDAAVLDVIFGQFNPVGRLPFEMPSSMEAVRKQKEDMPYDSENPSFPFGHGLTYDE